MYVENAVDCHKPEDANGLAFSGLWDITTPTVYRYTEPSEWPTEDEIVDGMNGIETLQGGKMVLKISTVGDLIISILKDRRG